MSALTRSSRNIVILATSIFVVLILVTMKLESGEISLGYPWAFYSYSQTEADLQSSLSWSIQPAFFILEWLMIAVFVMILNEGIKKMRR